MLNKKIDGRLRYQVYRRKSHTKRYLHADYHHHPTQKVSIIHTLATRATIISDEKHLNYELDNLSMVF
jgi:hypothetical protein